MLSLNSFKLFCCLMWCCVANAHVAFPQVFEWVKINNSEGFTSRFSAIITDNNGNVYVANDFIGSVYLGGQTLTSVGNDMDTYVAKYSPQGDVLWVRHITGIRHQNIYGLAITPEGHILATGTFQYRLSIDGFTLAALPSDNGDTFIIKFQSDGTAIMAKNIGYAEVNLADTGYGITTDSDGNIYVAGGRGTSMYFSKWSSTGNLLWRYTYGRSSSVGSLNAGDIAVDSQGYVYVAGLSQATGDGYLHKLSRSGGTLWTQTFKGFISGLEVDEDDRLLLTGDIFQTTTLGSQSFPSKGGILGKMDANGKFLWQSFLPGYAARSFSINPTGSTLYFSGAITGTVRFDSFELVAEELSDVIIGEISGNGLFQWVARAGEKNRTFGDLIASDDDGNIFIAGSIKKDSVARFQCDEKTGQSKSDMYVAKIAPFLKVPIFGPLELCEGEEATYFFTPVSDFTSYEWFNNNADLEVTAINPTTIKIKAKGKKLSAIGVRSTIDLGCEIFAVNHTIPITINPFLTKGSISGESEVCAGRSNVKYSISPGPSDTSYTWITEDDVTIQNSTDTELVLDFPDTFTSTEIGLIMTGACNSVTFDPFPIVAKPKPGPIGPVTTDEVLCAGQKSTFNIEPVPQAISYMWFIDVMGGPRYNRSGGTSFDVDVTSGAFRVSTYVQASNECGLIESPRLLFDVIQSPSETKPIVGPTELCEGREASFTTSLLSNAETFHWVFKTDAKITTLEKTQASNQISFTFAQPGTLTVRSMNACGEGPVASLPIAKIVDRDTQPVIERTCNSLFYDAMSAPLSWFKDGEPLGTDPSIQINQGGVYELRYIGECIERSDFITIDNDDFDIFIPTVFTPNGDNKNETFQISKFLQGSKVTIYNRWGEPVYSSDNYDNGWDGGNISTGIYYYAIDSGCSNFLYKGVLSIIK